MSDIKDQLKDAIPCDSVFRSYYPDHWRAEGNSICPFHDDKNASLQVDAKFAFCHAESKRWDIFDLYTARHGGGFREAVVGLSDMIGLSDEPMPEPVKRNGNGASHKKAPLGEIQATYDYVDEDGKLIFQVVRYGAPPPQNKEFRQRIPNGKRGWSWKFGDTRRVLYRLPQVIENKGVFLVEGEKDADNLNALGICATTSPQGAKKWDTLVEKWSIHLPLRDKHVTIIPDNDEPGLSHAQQVAQQLQPFAASVKILELPGLPEKGDVSDFIDMHGDEAKDRLLALVAATEPESEPDIEPTEPETAPIPEAINLTDMGNAQRLARRFGRRIRHCSALGWMVYDGKRWLADDTSRLQACAKEIARGLYTEGANELDEDRRRAMIRFALKCESASKIQAMLQLLPSEPGIAIPVDSFDKDPYLFNCLNGTIDLRTGRLRPHDPADMISKIAPVEYHPDATCEPFMNFFRSTQPDNDEVQDFIWRALGYAMTGITKEQVWFFLSGKGSNGKGTLLTAVSEILGDYYTNTPADTFLEQKGQTGRNDLARLRGARLVTASEPEGKRFDPAVLKTFTGEDPITARYLYREYFDFLPVWKLFFSANKRPGVSDHSTGFWRRVILIPFDQDFSDPSIKDTDLRDKHRATQYPGIFAWLVRGCREWMTKGLNPPACITEAVDEYRKDTDPLGDFFDTRCDFGPGLMASKTLLHAAYSTYCEQRRSKPLGYTTFNREIGSRAGIYPDKKPVGGSRVHVWVGLRLREDTDPQPAQTFGAAANCDACEHGDLCGDRARRNGKTPCDGFRPKQIEQENMYAM